MKLKVLVMAAKKKKLIYKNNRLHQLRGFCLAAQAGNISRAAEQMGLTHSSVSLQIKALESDMKVSLFERNGPQIRLTREGEKLLELALPHINAIQELPKAFEQALPPVARTELRIAASRTALNCILPGLVKKYSAAWPDIFISIHYAEHSDAMLLLLKDEVDIALLPRREHMTFPGDCEYMPVFYFKPSLITRRGHPLAERTKLTVQEIGKYELMFAAEELHAIPNLYEKFPKHDINKKLRIDFADWETTRKFIEAGLVVSIASAAVIGDGDALVATPLPHLFPMVDYGFVTRKGRAMPEKISLFIDLSRKSKN